METKLGEMSSSEIQNLLKKLDDDAQKLVSESTWREEALIKINMDNKKEVASTADAIQNRVDLNKVVIDTPALLNMIKHCQDNRLKKTCGYILGVMKKEIGQTSAEENSVMHNNLHVTSIHQDNGIKDLKTLIQNDNEQKKSNNQVGIYVSCELGLAFTYNHLMLMLLQYRNFRNSVMVVYDVNKSQFGMNPLGCYRLSVEAVKAFNLENLQTMTDSPQLVQDKIKSSGLTIANFFLEVPMKLHRSNLLQAFLFDHIQPRMPTFNTNIFNAASNQNYISHHIHKASEVSQQMIEELNKVENQHKKMIQTAKKQNKKIQQMIVSNKDKTVKGSSAEKEDREALESFKVTDSSDSKLDLFLFSNEVDALISSINQFDDCFPDVEMKQETATEETKAQ